MLWIEVEKTSMFKFKVKLIIINDRNFYKSNSLKDDYASSSIIFSLIYSHQDSAISKEWFPTPIDECIGFYWIFCFAF